MADKVQNGLIEDLETKVGGLISVNMGVMQIWNQTQNELYTIIVFCLSSFWQRCDPHLEILHTIYKDVEENESQPF